MSHRIFTTSEVVRITGFSRQQLDYYCKQNFVTPSARQASGKGTRRIYSLDDLVLLYIIRRLREHRWSIQKIRTALSEVRAFIGTPQEVVLIDGKGTILALCKTSAGEKIILDTLRPGGQQVLEIVLETVREKVIEETNKYNGAFVGE